MTDLSSSNKAAQRSGSDYVDINYRWNKFERFVNSPKFAVLPLIVAVAMLLVPGFSALLLLVFGLWFWYVKDANIDLPLRAPLGGPQKTTNDIAANGKRRIAAGITYYGICRDTMRRVYGDSDLDRQHRILVGTTGSGKTVSIVALNMATFIFGGGQAMLDGKGDKDFIYGYMALARRFLRTPCLLILDFATSRDIYERTTDFISNQINLPSQGSSGVLAEITKATADDGEGDIWSQRKDAWIELAYRLMFFFQDRHNEVATMSNFSKYLDLRYFIDRYLDPRLVKDNGGKIVTAQCTDFMSTLPGLEANQLDKIHSGEQQLSNTTLDQWGYVVMSVAPALSLMTRQYWHIFDTRALSDIDFEDSFIGDRLMFGLLPALQKSESAMRSLGKLIVGLMQSMYGKIMPQDLVGNFKMLKDIQASNSPYYYQVFYDEAGYYLSTGSEKQQAQLRSLQVSITVACQNYGQLEKSGEDVAEGIWGSSNIKIFGKIEDSGKTYEKIRQRLGEKEKWVAGERAIEYTASGKVRYLGPTRVTKEKFDVVSINKLANQVEGQFVMAVGGDTIINLKTPYFTARVDELRPNIYMPMSKPKVEVESAEFLDFKKGLKKLVVDGRKPEEYNEYIRGDQDLRSVLSHVSEFDSKVELEGGLLAIYKHIDSIYETSEGPDPSELLKQLLGAYSENQDDTPYESNADSIDVSSKEPGSEFQPPEFDYDSYPEADKQYHAGDIEDFGPASPFGDLPTEEFAPVEEVEVVNHSAVLSEILGSLDAYDDDDDGAYDGHYSEQIPLQLDSPGFDEFYHSPSNKEGAIDYQSAGRASGRDNGDLTNEPLEDVDSFRVTASDLESRDENEISLGDILADTLGNEHDPLLVAADLAGVKPAVEAVAVQNTPDDEPPVDVTSPESRDFLEQLAKSIEGPVIDVDIRLPSFKKKK
ncbi:TraM recognition domain-containing protein [Reinekea sp. G2M2-21]|uniref:TraM recognition domain-containing protein n=1 Tax=Reinekea sp. G2M2-21 TaxID=2788942 RepID=UPI0018AA5D38|nr:TraM recognition domain-containing protein [Reinekea sp. G2M2-21]